ncbi:VOC family protein [Fulvivirgaceae bacterium BMA10]|uniref:VOC family protein n=1 Tax=Splendidivirga corallicola TaxID=3051826 RepID=A0ABT8KWU3_9BACT|nr:VOC family protein [Fulvivirgaceae bacterium BMA10]
MKIQELVLNSNKLDLQKNFYSKKLGFEIIEEFGDGFSIQTGATRLSFVNFTDQNTNYHFAFQISKEKIKVAREWLINRDISLLKETKTKSDLVMGKSLYFRDPDGNIVEFIGRSVEDRRSAFAIESVLRLSEIGLPTKDTFSLAKKLIDDYHIVPKDEEEFNHDFCWVGDDDGVLIVVKEGRHWIPTNCPSIASDFQIKIKVQGREYAFKSSKGEIENLNVVKSIV